MAFYPPSFKRLIMPIGANFRFHHLISEIKAENHHVYSIEMDKYHIIRPVGYF